MAVNPKAKILLSKVKSLSEEGRNNWLQLLSVLEEIPEPDSDINSMVLDDEQYDRIRRGNARKRTIKTVLGFIAFLILYIIAGSVAPTHWTPAGTIPTF